MTNPKKKKKKSLKKAKRKKKSIRFGVNRPRPFAEGVPSLGWVSSYGPRVDLNSYMPKKHYPPSSKNKKSVGPPTTTTKQTTTKQTSDATIHL